MPLIKGKSKQAFGKNVETEREAGKPQKQSLAIAFSVQRKNKKKMALGGAVEGEAHSGPPYDRDPGVPAKKPDNEREPEAEYMSKNWSEGDAPARKPDDKKLPDSETMAGHFAKGGAINPKLQQSRAPHRPVHPMDLMSDDERATSIADAILEKRHRMAEGGMVDLEENSEEEGSTPYDEMNAEAGEKEQYDDSQLGPQPADSNEHGDSREFSESDPHDMVESIRRKLKAGRG